MEKVYLVKFKTTGEVWHSCVCAGVKTAEIVMRGYGITSKTHENDGFAEYVSPTDPSQTATVSLQKLVNHEDR